VAVLGAGPTNTYPILVEPNSQELRVIGEQHQRHPGASVRRAFQLPWRDPQHAGADPCLALLPAIARSAGTPADAVVERIPQMVLSLLKAR